MSTLTHTGALPPGKGGFDVPAGTTRIYYYPSADEGGRVSLVLGLAPGVDYHTRLTKLRRLDVAYPTSGNGTFEYLVWLDSEPRRYTHVASAGYRTGNADYEARDGQDTHYRELDDNYWGAPTYGDFKLAVPGGATIAPARDWTNGAFGPKPSPIDIETMSIFVDHTAGTYPYLPQPWRLDIYPATIDLARPDVRAAPRGAASGSFATSPSAAKPTPRAARGVYGVSR